MGSGASEHIYCVHSLTTTITFTGTKACEKVLKIITSTYLRSDVRKLSSGMQTSSVEAFHSVVNHFALKLLSFSYEGMCSRYVISLVGQCYCKCFVPHTLHPPIDYYWLHSTSMRTAPELRLLSLPLVKAGTKSVTPSTRRVNIP